MEQKLFRKKSMDKISSPDDLNDYIRVSNPGIWMVLGAMIILLLGACAWGVFGTVETKIPIVAVSEGRNLVCYIPEDEVDVAKEGMEIRIDKNEYHISSIGADPIQISSNDFDEYTLHVGNLQEGQWVYEAKMDGRTKEGTYLANLITEQISPMSFVFN